MILLLRTSGKGIGAIDNVLDIMVVNQRPLPHMGMRGLISELATSWGFVVCPKQKQQYDDQSTTELLSLRVYNGFHEKCQ